MTRKLRLLMLAICAGSSALAIEPESDFGAWFGLNVQKRVTRTFSLNLNPQVRFNRNATAVDQYMVDAGGEFRITRNLRASLNYRHAQSNRLDYYSARHRLFVDVNLREKVGRFTLGLRERTQAQVQDLASSDIGKYPVWYLRGRLSAKYDTGLPWKPYVSMEVFYRLRDPGKPERSVDQYRYETGIDYAVARDHSVNVFYMLKRNPEDRVMNEFILGLGYEFVF